MSVAQRRGFELGNRKSGKNPRGTIIATASRQAGGQTHPVKSSAGPATKLTFHGACAGPVSQAACGDLARASRVTERTHGLEHGLTNYGDRDFSLYLRRSFAQSMGYSRAMLSKPVVGIAYTPSGFNNCHRHFPELLDAVKRGVLAAGALPIAFPTISLGEVFLSPTSLKYRNLMSIDT